MDPLSFSASIVALLQLTGTLINYLNDVKEASKERAKLAIETSNIQSSLMNLRFRIDDSNDDDQWFVGVRSLSQPKGPLDQLKTDLEALVKNLEPAEGILGIKRTLTWTFNKSDVSTALQRIERLKSLIALALDNDIFNLSLAMKNDLNDVKGGVSQIQYSLAGIEIKQEDSIRINLISEQLKIAEWMSPLDFLRTRSDVFSKRQPETGQWFLDSGLFRNWAFSDQSRADQMFASDDSRELWCPGIPGAGKTILASLVAEHLEAVHAKQNVAVVSIFCNYKDHVQQTTPALVGSIMKQILQTKSQVSETCRAFYHEYTRKGAKPTVGQYIQLLVDECFRFERVFVIVDALDEMSDGDGTRSSLLNALRFLPYCVKLLVTSRPLATIQNQFIDSQLLEIRADDEDIRKYIRGRVSRETRLSRHAKSDPALLDAIMTAVVNSARGMFLLAQLHLDALVTKNNRRAISIALRSLPKGYDATYEEAMCRIQAQNEDDRELANKVLSWITYAFRPLSVAELQNGLAVQPGDADLDLDALPDEEILLSVCAGLISIEKESNTVRLVHYTTQEYFERTRDELFPDARVSLATICLTYIHFDTFEEGPCSSNITWYKRVTDYPLFGYASSHWGDHARQAGSENFKSQILALYSSESKLTSMLQAMKTSSGYWSNSLWAGYSQRFPKGTYALWLSAHFGLGAIVEEILATGVSSNECIFKDETALAAAASQGHVEVVQQILDYQTDSTMELSWDQNAFTQAAGNRHHEILLLLIQHKRKFPGRLSANIAPWEALEQATLSGEEATVRLLLDNVQMEMTEDNWHSPWSALSVATAEKEETIAYLLLQYGADVRATSKYQSTLYVRSLPGEHKNALVHAAANGMTLLLKVLIEKLEEKYPGGDGLVTKIDRFGDKPKSLQDFLNEALLEGAANGHADVVELLVLKGADIEASSMLNLPFEQWNVERRLSDYANALHLAVRGGHESTVLRVLKLGADISSKSLQRSPLHTAAAHNMQSMAALLMAKGAIPDLLDGNGILAVEEAAAAGNFSMILMLSGPNPAIIPKMLQVAFEAALRSGQDRTVDALMDDEHFDRTAANLNSSLILTIESSHEKSRSQLKSIIDDFNQVIPDPWERYWISGYVKIARRLCEKGADWRTAYSTYTGKEVPSAIDGTDDAIQEICIHEILNVIEKLDFNAINDHGSTPLMYAARNGGLSRVRWLVSQPGIKLQVQEGPGNFSKGRTAFAFAAESGETDVVSFLLEQDGIDVNSRDDNGDTPLALAASNGHHAVVGLLLSHPMIIADSINIFGETPLSKATQAVFEKVLVATDIRPGFSMRLPKTSWFDIPSGTDNERKSKNNGRRHDEVARLLLQRQDVDPAAEDAFGQLPVTRAAGSWGISGKVFEILLERGCPDSVLLGVVESVVGNRIRGKEFIEVIFQKHPDFPITESILAAAVGGYADEQVIELLMDRVKDLEITETVLVSAASNVNSCGALKIVLDRRPHLAISASVFEAASANIECGDSILKLLLSRAKSDATTEIALSKLADKADPKFSLVAFLIFNFKNAAVTPEALKNAVLGSSDLQKALIPSLFTHLKHRPDLKRALMLTVLGYLKVSLAEVMLDECSSGFITDDMVDEIAHRQSSDMIRMFLRRGIVFSVTEKIFKSLYSTFRWADGPAVLKLLLESQRNIKFSDEMKCLIFSYGSSEVAEMVLGTLSTSEIDETLLQSAAGNSNSAVLVLVLSRYKFNSKNSPAQASSNDFRSSVNPPCITDAVISAAAINGCPESLELLLNSSGRDISISKEIVISAAKKSDNKNLPFLLEKYNGPDNIGLDVLIALIGEPPVGSSPDTIKCFINRREEVFSVDNTALQNALLAATKIWHPDILKTLIEHQKDAEVSEELFEAALDASPPHVFEVLFAKTTIAHFNEHHFQLAAGNITRKGRKIIRKLLERDQNVQVTFPILVSFSSSGDLELVKETLEHDPSLSITDEVLAAAASSQRKKIMKWLLNEAHVIKVPESVLLAAATRNKQHRYNVMLMLIEEFIELDFTEEIILAAADWMWSFVLDKMLKKYKESHTTEAMLIKACECQAYGNIESFLKQKTVEPISEAVLQAAAGKGWRPADAVSALLDFDAEAHAYISDAVIEIAKANEDKKVLEVLLQRQKKYTLSKN